MSDTVLVLDDELSYAEMLRELLTEHGFSSEVATDPREALERLHSKSYALIVTDFKMPEVDGGQFLVEARRIIPQIPVIMVSGLMTTADLLRVANIGVTLVLEKPFNVDVFVDYVRRYVSPQEVIGEGGEEIAKSTQTAASHPGAVEGNYPQPLRYLVDYSEVSRVFLQDLWEAVSGGARHCLIQLPVGAEFSDLVKELGGWKGRPGLAAFHFSVHELRNLEVRQMLVDLSRADASSPVIAVTLPNGAHLDAGALRDFVHWANGERVIRDRLTFVYGLPYDVEVAEVIERVDAEAGVAGPFNLRPIRERLSDLAAYVGRFLEHSEAAGCQSLDPSAVGILLQHDWPGNHRELMSVLRRAFMTAKGPFVSGDDLRRAIRSRAERQTLDGLQLDLESFLLLEQRRFLRSHAGVDADLKTIADVAGVQFERLDTNRSSEDQPLLFPEILEGQSPS
jgi:CheY-like chemotaxis protein